MTQLTHFLLLAPIFLFIVGTPALLWVFAES